ncbi:peptide chain release factor 2 [Thermodesulfobacteriota bacterium]
MSVDLKQILKEQAQKLLQLKAIFDLAGKEKRLKEIEALITKDSFWESPETSKSILKERTLLSDKTEAFKKLAADFEENEILLDLAIEETDEEVLEEVTQQARDFDERIKKYSLDIMLDGADDRNDAIVSINAGAGGTDAQDWAEMLFRMYIRWIERKSFEVKIIDLQPGDEAGIKSVTFAAGGPYAYGYLKTESGVHRLVRISPFNASGKRHTSFASVFVYPEVDSEIIIAIEDNDLRVDVFRASGAGGQHVNKTSSAVRITHLPTGIVVQCQQEKSQHRNKDLAMKVLKARLYQREKERMDEKFKEIHEGKDDIAWGSQIRSYVMHPYQMVKDHRINLEKGNVNAVLDGALDPFIEGILLADKAQGYHS